MSDTTEFIIKLMHREIERKDQRLQEYERELRNLKKQLATCEQMHVLDKRGRRNN